MPPMSTSLASILNTDCVESAGTKDLFDEMPESDPITKDHLKVGRSKLLRLTGEFWTSGQRQASSLQEISYRACFKPQLPRYFIKRFTAAGDTVYDPFSGRGTAVIEAGLMGRRAVANDVNPLSR